MSHTIPEATLRQNHDAIFEGQKIEAIKIPVRSGMCEVAGAKWPLRAASERSWRPLRSAAPR